MDDVVRESSQEATDFDDGHVHELRNRLTVVKGMAQLLDRQVRRDDWQRDRIIYRLDRLQDEICQLEQLLDRPAADDASDPDVVKDQLH
jgi:nitrogen-specific signal transduction histidine kinase